MKIKTKQKKYNGIQVGHWQLLIIIFRNILITFVYVSNYIVEKKLIQIEISRLFFFNINSNPWITGEL